jgi:hypothetical protein
MYAPPPAIVPASGRSGLAANGALLAVCCLALILFLIAATIVLALIPVYLPSRSATLTRTTQTYYFVLTPNGTIGDDGTLSSTDSTTLYNAICASLGFPAGCIKSQGNVLVASSSSKRRRRGFGLTRTERAITQKWYFAAQFFQQKCGTCPITITTFIITITITYGGKTQVVTITVTIFTITITFPVTLSSSTTPTTVSTSSTTATPAIG